MLRLHVQGGRGRLCRRSMQHRILNAMRKQHRPHQYLTKIDPLLLLAATGCSSSDPANRTETTMIAQTPDNRIVFVGSPWPKGHAIKEFAWSAQLDPNSGIWFGLHLVSDKYDAEDTKRGGDDN